MTNFSADITIKSPSDLQKMVEGGRKLAEIKGALRKKVAVGTSAFEIEALAEKLISRSGGQASFKMVPGYRWNTCINVNQGVVHGIPKKSVIFQKGDIVSVDVGLYFRGFHTDTSFSVGLNPDKGTENFLHTGQKAMEASIQKVKNGNKIGDISRAIQTTIESGGYSVIRNLVGHGVGKNLHEGPAIPCFVSPKESSVVIKTGMTLAIEVMYALGSPELEYASDGWTINVRDGKISALFEETVAVTPDGPLVLTQL